MESNDKPLTVSRFEHENALMHYGAVNKRSMIVNIAVCITCVLMTLIFVVTYTIRDREWKKLFVDVLTNRAEVQTNGVYEQPDTGAD